MNEHLTHQELTDHLLGTRSATVEAHLASCPACSKELYQFRESLGTFRSAVRNWSEAERPVQRQVFPAPRSFDWLLVGAMALVLLTFSLVFWGDRGENIAQNPPTPSQQAVIDDNSLAQIQQDNELLSNINQELSEGLPAPMQPLQVADSGTTGKSSNQ
ncbi:MAG TPA: hypothetical protein VLK33_22280 [Terriglobales bacterium]|nr:hypothetical protein [Terriglobales bacterium]